MIQQQEEPMSQSFADRVRAKMASLASQQPVQQHCAFCGAEYRYNAVIEGYRPGAVCADCWPQVAAIERGQ